MTVFLLILLLVSPLAVAYMIFRVYMLQKDINNVKDNVRLIKDCTSTLSNNVNSFISKSKKCDIDVIEVQSNEQ